MEYDALLQELSENITNEDLDQLKSACKEDIPSEKNDEITSCLDWFNFLEKHDKLAKDNLAYIFSDIRILRVEKENFLLDSFSLKSAFLSLSLDSFGE